MVKTFKFETIFTLCSFSNFSPRKQKKMSMMKSDRNEMIFNYEFKFIIIIIYYEHNETCIICERGQIKYHNDSKFNIVQQIQQAHKHLCYDNFK